MENILLISKEILRSDYLSCYGSKLYRTPNIDKLAEKGTIFMNCYSPAPSTAMAITCMFSGLNAHELVHRRDYVEVKKFTQVPTLFSILNSKGYETYVVWPTRFQWAAERYSKVFDENTKVINLPNVGRIVPMDDYKRGKTDTRRLEDNSSDIEEYFQQIARIVENNQKPVFIWAHLPHVLKPVNCYGSDIGLFDQLVGKLMESFDGSIYLTADHGHMNFEKNIMGYGFHVYEGALKVPLITPRLIGKEVIEEPTSLAQLKNIILEKKVYPQKYVYSDSQYYLQPDRKLAIRKGDFKYIYNKKERSEELYDLSIDPDENVNLLVQDWYNRDRKRYYPLDEVYYYRRWDEAEKAYRELKAEKERIWIRGSILMSLLVATMNMLRPGLFTFFKGILPRRKAVRGRWGSATRVTRS